MLHILPSFLPPPPLRAAPALVCSKDLRRARKIEHLSSRSVPPSLPCCCLLSFGSSFVVMTSGGREGGIDETVGLLSCPETQSNEYLTTSRAFLKVKEEMHWRERETERHLFHRKYTSSICDAPSVLCSTGRHLSLVERSKSFTLFLVLNRNHAPHFKLCCVRVW